ncbi:hypothetical protein NS506_02594 [Nocardia seriolae]|uniref:Uncharacterized protein n=1 Tax=Nocardia seriolae TaxID=37332 RepID=A0ABC8AR59_9NOCA|nr:hypothetical protein NS506_02594 [Nocardia seriolae]
MAAGVYLAFVEDETEVVERVFAEHAVVLLGVDGTLGQLAACPARQAHVGHGGFEAFEGVAAGGVEFPGHLDQRCALGVELNGVEPLAFILGFGVDVSEPGIAVGAAVDGLLQHLVLNVESLQLVLQVVHDVEHPLHGFGVGALAEVLFHRDQPNAHLLQLDLDDRGVESVAERAGAHVHDHVLDLGMIVQVGDHLPERLAAGESLCGLARLDELLHHLSAETVGLRGPLLALSVDRQSVGVDIDGRVSLAFAGYPQVENGGVDIHDRLLHSAISRRLTNLQSHRPACSGNTGNCGLLRGFSSRDPHPDYILVS